MAQPVKPKPPPESEIREDDLARARQAWKDSVPAEFKNLLDAEGEQKPRP